MRADVEAAAGRLLAAAAGVRCFLEVPPDRPAEFISVELTGSSADGLGVRTEAQLAVQSWAPTRRRAREIASAVEAAVPSISGEPWAFSARASSTYRFPDPASRTPRYQTTVELVICE